MKLYIAVPTHGLWFPEFGHSLALMMADLAVNSPVDAMRLTRCEATILSAGRMELAREALQEGASHVLWLDSDMKFRPLNVRALISAEKDIVAADYVRKQPPYRSVATGDRPINPNGLTQVEHVGMGLMLTKTSVFRALPQPWFETPWRDETQDYVGEDVWFCRRARENGFSVFVSGPASAGVAHVGKFAFEQRHAAAIERAA
jgi:hypothetical protein